jgi:hypothetical protein
MRKHFIEASFPRSNDFRFFRAFPRRFRKAACGSRTIPCTIPCRDKAGNLPRIAAVAGKKSHENRRFQT